MALGTDDGVPHARHNLLKTEAAVQLRAQRDRVDEVADQRLQLGRGAVGPVGTPMPGCGLTAAGWVSERAAGAGMQAEKYREYGNVHG